MYLLHNNSSVIVITSQLHCIFLKFRLLIFIITFLLVNVYPIKLLFGKKAPTIVIGKLNSLMTVSCLSIIY